MVVIDLYLHRTIMAAVLLISLTVIAFWLWRKR